jgi:hypothetical protein
MNTGEWRNAGFWGFGCCGVEQGGLPTWEKSQCCMCGCMWFRPALPERKRTNEQKKNQKKTDPR